jgi:Rieske Fe-S protein
MSREPKISRRSFVKLCASTIAMVGANPSLLAQPDSEFHRYRRARLVDTEGRPVTPTDLKVGENYLFHYPYIATPCFLLNLGRPTEQHTLLKTEDGKSYRWQGGVGPKRSIVAFSAICAHKMSHPARTVSFINYRHKAVRFRNKDEALTQRPQVIYCCSEKSVYDPLQGARVLGGPAPQPLAAILLEYDERDGSLYAAGSYGGEMFERFFEKFSFRLGLEFNTANVREEVANTAVVVPLAQYCQTQVLC